MGRILRRLQTRQGQAGPRDLIENEAAKKKVWGCAELPPHKGVEVAWLKTGGNIMEKLVECLFDRTKTFVAVTVTGPA